jgi:hypothetical protein
MCTLGFIAKHLFSDSYGPFDRFVEFAVLAVIAYEAIHHAINHRRIGKRKAVILDLMNEGQSLLAAVASTRQPERVAGWTRQVEDWIAKTQTILQGYSSQASGSFNHLRLAPFNYPDIAPGAHDHFKVLQARIENLRSIMEKPEVYY